VRGAIRVDLLVTEGENEYVLEVNTLPGMTRTSLLPKIAKGAGMEFGDLCEAILKRARLYQRRPEDLDPQETSTTPSPKPDEPVQAAAL
jgi:hypothetical protein